VTGHVDQGVAVVSDIPEDTRRVIRELNVTFTGFTWAPSGRHLYLEGYADAGRNIWRMDIEPRTLAWIGLPERLTTGGPSYRDVAISRDGTKLAVSAQFWRTTLWSFTRDPISGRVTNSGEPATSWTTGEQNPAFKADGRTLVYETVRGDREELWQRSIDDERERLVLTRKVGPRTRLHWSPDGTQVAYARTVRQVPDAASDVVLQSASGGGERILARVPMSFNITDWSPDGKWLVATCADPLKMICRLPVVDAPDADPVTILARDPARHLYLPRFSPNQQWISFHAAAPGDSAVSTLYVAPVGGGRWRAITDGSSWVDKNRWSPDGRTLYFISNRGGFQNVWARRFDPAAGEPMGESFRVTAFETPRQLLPRQRQGLEIGVSAERLVLPMSEVLGNIWTLDGIADE
jgi:Tol biopolymer transport system component